MGRAPLAPERVAARSVASPVFERIDRSGSAGKVLGTGSRSAFIGVGDFVIAITRDRFPLLPNGITIPMAATNSFRRGDPVSVSPGRIEAAGLVVELAGATTWDPTVAFVHDCTRNDILRRGVSILEACGVSAEPAPPALANAIENRLESQEAAGLFTGIEGLFDALTRRDRAGASVAARRLAGKGPGLTPEGDDLLAAVAGAVVAFGPAAGFDDPERRMWLGAIGAQQSRMTALSATLLGLALRGMVIEPAGCVMNLCVEDDVWLRALARLKATGHGTGRAYALAIGAAASLLGTRVPVH